MPKSPTIIYTKTDEAPALATYSLLPIIQAFTKHAGIKVEARDISLAKRILANFPEWLAKEQRVTDALAELSALTLKREANIIKLPNVSASVPQLKAAIGELQSHGYKLPAYPESPRTDSEKEIKMRYDRIKGSAVNPVLRQGNSDRRPPKAAKEYARKHPHSMGKWSRDSRTDVRTMNNGDFYSNEKSVTLPAPTNVRIEFVAADGTTTLLRNRMLLEAGEILDGTFMSKRAFVAFIEWQFAQAKEKRVLFSLHLKATMMKVSDPIIFGNAVRVYFRALLEKHAALFVELGVDLNNGIGDLVQKIQKLPDAKKAEIEADIQATYAAGPAVAMVDSARGITNFHTPSDVIVDASMPAMIRSSGKMHNAEGKLQDTLAVIPDRSYAGVYQTTIDFCKRHGAFEPEMMGSVSNVGLMAQAAEEYGSHDKTFLIHAKGMVRVVDDTAGVLIEHAVDAGDIWRACQTKDAAVQDWVKLAVNRARATNTPGIFWLDEKRAHDAQIIAKVKTCLAQHDTKGLCLRVLDPTEAAQFTLDRVEVGEDTISITGNVLRDYLTDLFPILELGTSAKMLSIVPLMNGGGLFETGAGGSAPKHVEQFLHENYLRWDSLGEFFALAASFEHLSKTFGSAKAKILADTLDEATGKVLENDKVPTRKLGGLDNRGSHFYLALYWAQALAAQAKDTELQAVFRNFAGVLTSNELRIVGELNAVQGRRVDLAGYYLPNDQLATVAMRPSGTFNEILNTL